MNHKPRKWIKGLLAGVLALGASAVLASPALADTTVECWGLKFSDPSGLMNQSGTKVQQAGTTADAYVTIEGGSGNITVSPTADFNPADAPYIVIGDGASAINNFTGTLTLSGVTLAGDTDDAPIQFQNHYDAAASANNAGSTVVVTNGTRLVGEAANQSIVTANSQVDDTLVFAGSSTIAPASAATVATIYVNGTGNANQRGGLTVETDYPTTVPATGTGAAFFVDEGTATTYATATFTGNAQLTLSGSGGSALVIGHTTAGGAITVAGGVATVHVSGGNVLATTGAHSAVAMNADCDTTEAFTQQSLLDIDSGILKVVSTDAGASGAFAMTAADTADAAGSTANCINNVVIQGGTLAIAAQGSGADDIAINGVNKQDSQNNIALSNGTDTNLSGGTLITQSTTNTNVTTGANTTVNVAANVGNTADSTLYPWLAQSMDTPPTSPVPYLGNGNNVLGFAGSINGSDDPQNLVPFLNSTFGTPAVAQQWVKISPFAVSALTATDVHGYVWATTDEYLNSSAINNNPANIPSDNPERIVDPVIAASFEGLDTSEMNFAPGAYVQPGVNGTFSASPSDNVKQIPGTKNLFYVVPDAQGNHLDVSFTGLLNPVTMKLYPKLDVLSGTINVVYTANITTNPTYGTFVGTAGPVPTGLPVFGTPSPNTYKNGQVVTAIDGTGTLTSAGEPDATNAKVASFRNAAAVTNTTGETIYPAVAGVISPVNNINYGATQGTGLLCMLQSTTGEDGSAATEIVPLDQVNWDQNVYLTACFATVNIGTPQPSPASLARGGSVELTATVKIEQIFPEGNALGDYVMTANTWRGGLNAGSVNSGNLSSNGITLTPGTVTNEGNGTYKATCKVSANDTATYASYRVWWENQLLTGGRFGIDSNATEGDYNNSYPYAVVSVSENSGLSGESIVYRLYNPYSYEHLYTTSRVEYDLRVSQGWNDEGVAWIAPESSQTPVYRLYNPYSYDHYYCTSRGEANYLVGLGWKYDFDGQPAFYSAPQSGVPIYQLFNPYETTNTHLWTGDFAEYTANIARGWKGDGTAWYAISL